MSEPTLEGTRELYVSPRFALAEETWETRDGRVTRPVIHHPGAVALLVQPMPSRVLLVRQFRYPIRRWTLEIPAGTRVAGEPAEATARRELREEAGFECGRLIELMRFFPAVGVSDEELILYRAEDLRAVPSAPEPGELIEAESVSLGELPGLAVSGEICDAKTIIALALLGVSLPRRVEAPWPS
jgi:ADP-ribose pyrophosphatase